MKENFKLIHSCKAMLHAMRQFHLNTNCSCKQILISIIFVLTFKGLAAQDNKLWLTAGQNLHNTRNAAGEKIISASTVTNIAVKWVFTTAGDVSATPAVDDRFVYFPDWAGNLYKVDANTGAQRWKKKITDYTGETKGFARATPAVAGNMLIIGTQLGDSLGAYILAINKQTGNLVWKTKVDDHPSAIITQSAVVSGGRIYVGVSSAEEGFATDSTYQCCSFRGSMLSLDLKTGKILWKTYMVPEGKGFSGGAVWGSTPVIDSKRNSVYITTGNDYTVPQEILDCVAAGGSSEKVKACIDAVDGSAENYFDAAVSLNLNTGAIKWVKTVIPFDAWNVACLFEGPNCPDTAGPDYDFGQGPALFTVSKGAHSIELLGAGQKSGTYWAFNPDNGNEVWHRDVGPGGTLGGLQWGSAVDSKRVFVAVSNHDYVPHTMTKGPGAGRTVKGGFWAALDPATGNLLWENAANNPPVSEDAPPDAIAANTGAVTLANGVAFGGALDVPGTMYAFNAITGEKLWSFESGGSVNSGPAIVNGIVYWGSGYVNIDGTPNNKFYAFTVQQNNSNLDNGITANDHNLSDLISVYPNPAKDKITIIANDKSNISRIQLFDLAGRWIKDFQIPATAAYNLNLASVPAGSYIIHITTLKQNISKEIIVTH